MTKKEEGRGRLRPERNIVTMMVAYGTECTLAQRIGYALLSLCALALGLSFLLIVADDYRNYSLLSAFVWAIPSFLLLAVGSAGLLNVLKFPKR